MKQRSRQRQSRSPRAASPARTGAASTGRAAKAASRDGLRTGAPRVLVVRNRQQLQAVDTRQLKRILAGALRDDLGVTHYELCIHLVGAGEMTCVNETFLKHEGSTDVITFSHGEEVPGSPLHGEIFVCVEEAMALAPRFRTHWPAEVVRYAIHGLLHLLGFDDHDPADRRRMKREENRVVRSIANRFAVARLGRKLSPDR
jgi:probable rRNA maturation factor